MGNGIPITCTTTYQKWTGQPIHLAGSKNPLPLGMGSVKPGRILFRCALKTGYVKCMDENGNLLNKEDHKYQNAYEKFLTLLLNINSYHRNGEIGHIGHSIFLMTQKEFSDCIDELRDGDYVFVIK